MPSVMMHWLVLFALCISHIDCVAINNMRAETMCNCGEDCVLRCTAQWGYNSGVQYRAVTWYKIGDDAEPQLNGLLMRSLPNGTTQWYVGVERAVELWDDSWDILLKNLTCKDSGTYKCVLSAPVGEQNQEGQVHLTVTGCPDSPSDDQMEDVYMVIFATVLLILSLLIFCISYSCLRKILTEKNTTTTHKEISLNSPFKPLGKKDLMLIHTLGTKCLKSNLKEICV